MRKRAGETAGPSLAVYCAYEPRRREILNQVLTLDERDRASAAGALIESLHGEVDPNVEEAWDLETRRRVEELESGAVEPIPWSEVRRRLF